MIRHVLHRHHIACSSYSFSSGRSPISLMFPRIPLTSSLSCPFHFADSCHSAPLAPPDTSTFLSLSSDCLPLAHRYTCPTSRHRRCGSAGAPPGERQHGLGAERGERDVRRCAGGRHRAARAGRGRPLLQVPAHGGGTKGHGRHERTPMASVAGEFRV